MGKHKAGLTDLTTFLPRWSQIGKGIWLVVKATKTANKASAPGKVTKAKGKGHTNR